MNFFSLTEDDYRVMAYNVACSAAVFMGEYFNVFLKLLTHGFLLLYFTKLYMTYDLKEQGKEEPVYPERPQKKQSDMEDG